MWKAWILVIFLKKRLWIYKIIINSSFLFSLFSEFSALSRNPSFSQYLLHHFFTFLLQSSSISYYLLTLFFLHFIYVLLSSVFFTSPFFFFNSVRQIYKADKIDRPDRMFGRSTFSNHTKIYRNRLMMSESSVVGADLSRTDPLRSDDHSNFLYCFFFVF